MTSEIIDEILIAVAFLRAHLPLTISFFFPLNISVTETPGERITKIIKLYPGATCILRPVDTRFRPLQEITFKQARALF